MRSATYPSECDFFNEGWEAYQHGEELRDCIYGEGTDPQEGWRLGWKAAKEEDTE